MIHAQDPVLVTGPSETIVSLSDAKAHLRVDHSDDDSFITALIGAATSRLDGWSGILGRCLITQTWRQDISGFPAGWRIPLPLAPLQSVSVAYFDEDGTEQTFASSAYHLVTRAASPWVELAENETWPATAERPDAVKIEMTAGYGDADADIPSAIRHAALLMIGHWYEHREDVVMGVTVQSVPLAVDALLAPFRRTGV